eukprot:1759476-Rhodomonas_salina.6
MHMAYLNDGAHCPLNLFAHLQWITPPMLALGAERGTFLKYWRGQHRSRSDHAVFAIHYLQPPEWMWHSGARGVFSCIAEHIEREGEDSPTTVEGVRDSI